MTMNAVPDDGMDAMNIWIEKLRKENCYGQSYQEEYGFGYHPGHSLLRRWRAPGGVYHFADREESLFPGLALGRLDFGDTDHRGCGQREEEESIGQGWPEQQPISNKRCGELIKYRCSL